MLTAAAPIAGPDPDLALLVAFDESEGQQRAALRTRYARQNAVLRLARTCPLLDATTRDVVAWLDSLELSPSARLHYIANLAHFYAWAVGEHLIQVDPTSPLRPKDRERRHYDFGDFPELVRGFWLAQQRRNLSPRTIDGRRAQLGRLQESLGERSLLDATTEDIERYLDSRKVEAKTRYINVSHFSAFYRWAVRENLIESDPTERIIRPELPRYLPRPIADADLIRALDGAAAPVAAMLSLAAFAGLRCKEIAGVQRADVLDCQRPAMLVVSAPKGRRQRIVPLHPDTWRALSTLSLPPSGPVFRRPDGRQVSPWTVSNTVSKHLHGLGIDGGAHSCRHWFASTLYRNTLDLRLCQELLGHANPATTAIYAAFSPGAAVDAVTALKPQVGP